MRNTFLGRHLTIIILNKAKTITIVWQIMKNVLQAFYSNWQLILKWKKFTTQIALFHIPTSGRLYLEHTHQKSCLAFIYFLANFRLDMSSHIFHSFSAKDTRSKTVPALHFTKWVEVLFLMSIFIFMQMWVFKRNLLNNSYDKSFYERLKKGMH